MKNSKTETVSIEESKVIAEKVNGYSALLGCIALIGAYSTTGQIIPGLI